MFNSKLDNLTIIIVTFRSRKVIFRNLLNIKNIKNIMILDNSNDLELKKAVRKKYKNIKFFTSRKNLGYAEGNNFLLKKTITDYVLILNPDCLVSENEILKAYNFIKLMKNKCAILGSSDEAKILKKSIFFSKEYYLCDYIKGFFMICDVKIIKKLNFFDSKFFLYLEEIDLCKRVRKKNFQVIGLKKIKIKHLAGKSSSNRREFQRLQNWHWMWSRFYYFNKHYGNLLSYIIFTPNLILSFLKTKIFKNNTKYNMRYHGLYNSMMKKKSFYRGK